MTLNVNLESSAHAFRRVAHASSGGVALKSDTIAHTARPCSATYLIGRHRPHVNASRAAARVAFDTLLIAVSTKSNSKNSRHFCISLSGRRLKNRLVSSCCASNLLTGISSSLKSPSLSSSTTAPLSSASAMRAPTASMTSREPVNSTSSSSSSSCGRACEDMIDPGLDYYESGLLMAPTGVNRCSGGG